MISKELREHRREQKEHQERMKEREKKYSSLFPLGTRDLIKIAAYTLAPGTKAEYEECVNHISLYWRVIRYKKKFTVDLGIGPMGYWSGELENLPTELR